MLTKKKNPHKIIRGGGQTHPGPHRGKRDHLEKGRYRDFKRNTKKNEGRRKKKKRKKKKRIKKRGNKENKRK